MRSSTPFVPFALSLFTACGGGESLPNDAPEQGAEPAGAGEEGASQEYPEQGAEPAGAGEENTPAKVSDLETLEALPDGLTALGDLDKAVAWNDGNGRNVAVFSHKRAQNDASGGSLSLFLTHDVTGLQARRLREVKDFENDCDADLNWDWLEQAVGVTDLDHDGVGELTFAYKKTCTSDVSPSELKLLLLEDGEKYIIRGTTRIKMGPNPEDTFGGDKTIDDSVKNGPAEFAGHLDSVWDKVVTEAL